MKFRVTPWEVEGKVNYEKLVREFGVKVIDNEIEEKIREIAGEVHPLIRRRFFFAHRDLDLILKEYEEGKKFFLYTGRAPSKSSMHIGHIIPFILTKWFQEKFDVNVYIMIPDEEKYLAKKAESIERVRELAERDALHIIALGFDPNRTFIFFNTDFIGNFYRLCVRIARHINLSVARAVFGFSGETSIGLIFYPSIQIAPTFFEENRCLIPCGIDQDPYFRIQRDIAQKIGGKKCSEILSKFVWGLEGPFSKMSASRPETCISLDDDPEIAKKKVWRAFTGGQPTIKEQREKGGNPEICSVFHWLEILFEEDDKKLREIYEKCRNGELICGECKQYLGEKIKEFLEKHQKNLKKAERLKERFFYDGKLAREMWEKKF